MAKIQYDKIFLIVDNFSTDRTFEIIKKLSPEYNIIYKQLKCTRGKGLEAAMELVKDISNDNDIFIRFDADTLYNENTAKLIGYIVKNIKNNCVYNFNIYLKNTNFAVKWKDLNNGEDGERSAHFIYNGYKRIIVNMDMEYAVNENIKNRERRYASGFNYVKRQLKNTIDVLIAFNIKNLKFLRRYISDSKIKNRLKIFMIYNLFLC